jgi:putative SOS response-associated peptidase YedK
LCGSIQKHITGRLTFWHGDSCHTGHAGQKAARKPINARAETIATSPMFRDAFARRRCLVPADLFYECQATDGAKQPFAIARADGATVVMDATHSGIRRTPSANVDQRATYCTAAVKL